MLRNRFRNRIFILTLILIIYIIKITFDKFPKIVHLIESSRYQAKNDYDITLHSKSLNVNSFKKFVVISSTVEYFKDYYMFYLPLVAQAWRRIKYEPIFLIASSRYLNESNSLAQIVLKYLKHLNVTLVHVPTKPNYEVITGMVCRLFCGLISDNLIRDNDFIITSDSDLFPISKSYFKVDHSSDNIKIWDAGSCDDFKFNSRSYEMYAMAHIGMKKSQWRKVMNLESSAQLNSNQILGLVIDLYGDSYVKTNSEIQRGKQTKYPVWFLDQMTISIKIDNYVNVLKKSNLTKIKFSGTRLNRGLFFNGNWLHESQLTYLTDFHAFHSDLFVKWKIMRYFLQQVFELNYVKLFDQYYREYMNERKKNQNIK